MSVALTFQDVARLLAEPSAEMRAELATRVGNSLVDATLAPNEITLAHEIVRILARDVEGQVRASLSYSLRHARFLPRDVAMKLADDIELVALPMLADSLALSDDDLIEIIRHGSARKQETIAGRPGLREAVCDALIVHAAEPAIVILLDNRSAAIAELSLDRAITRFAGSDRVKRAMVHREALPITVAERLVALVSQELREHLVRTHALSAQAASDIVTTAREHAISRMSAGASDDALRRMVTQMQHNGRLTATLMLRALCTGDIGFFEAALAVKGDVPLDNAQLLIHERSGQGFAALYGKAALPPALFTAMRAAINVVDETGFDGNPRDLERFRERVICRVLTSVSALDPADADYLLDRLGDVLVQVPDPALFAGGPADASQATLA